MKLIKKGCLLMLALILFIGLFPTDALAVGDDSEKPKSQWHIYVYRVDKDVLQNADRTTQEGLNALIKASFHEGEFKDPETGDRIFHGADINTVPSFPYEQQFIEKRTAFGYKNDPSVYTIHLDEEDAISILKDDESLGEEYYTTAFHFDTKPSEGSLIPDAAIEGKEISFEGKTVTRYLLIFLPAEPAANTITKTVRPLGSTQESNAGLISMEEKTFIYTIHIHLESLYEKDYFFLNDSFKKVENKDLDYYMEIQPETLTLSLRKDKGSDYRTAPKYIQSVKEIPFFQDLETALSEQPPPIGQHGDDHWNAWLNTPFLNNNFPVIEWQSAKENSKDSPYIGFKLFLPRQTMIGVLNDGVFPTESNPFYDYINDIPQEERKYNGPLDIKIEYQATFNPKAFDFENKWEDLTEEQLLEKLCGGDGIENTLELEHGNFKKQIIIGKSFGRGHARLVIPDDAINREGIYIGEGSALIGNGKGIESISLEQAPVLQPKYCKKVPVKKQWVDGSENPLPWPEGAQVRVRLLANGTPAKDLDGKDVPLVTLNASNPSHIFSKIPWRDSDGKTIEYTVKESGLKEGQQLVGIKSVPVSLENETIDGFLITNREDPTGTGGGPDPIEVTVKKKWMDEKGNPLA